MTDRRFINGPLAGTRLEIMASKPATTLADGSPIVEFAPSQGYNNAQTLAAEGQLVEGTFTHYWEGPSIAQEWKILARGERPFYRRSDQETYESSSR